MEPIFPQTKMIVFDLDCTLTNLHTCSMTTTPEQIQTALIDIYIQADVFRKFVDYLLESGVEVAIATYGRKEIAFTLMDKIFGSRSPFHAGNIITPADVSPNWRECYMPPANYNKNNMLSILAERYQLAPEQIMLVDDTLENINNARQVGYQTILAPRCRGFRETLSAMLKTVLPPDQIDPFIASL